MQLTDHRYDIYEYPQSLLRPGVRLAVRRIERCADRGSRSSREREAVAALTAYFFGNEADYRHHDDGSPYIVGSELYISVSHSRDYAAMAVSGQQGIGVDIEQMRPRQLERVASRFLSEKERRVYISDSLLLWAWSAKEAVYKAAGVSGLGGQEISLPEAFGFRAEAAGRYFSLRTIFTYDYCCVIAL